MAVVQAFVSWMGLDLAIAAVTLDTFCWGIFARRLMCAQQITADAVRIVFPMDQVLLIVAVIRDTTQPALFALQSTIAKQPMAAVHKIV